MIRLIIMMGLVLTEAYCNKEITLYSSKVSI